MFKQFYVLTSLLILVFTPLAHAGDISPESIRGATTIDVNQARALFEQEVLFVDVRKDQDWEAGRVPGAVHLNLKETYSEANLLKEISKDAKVVIYCNGEKCLRSSKACAKAVDWGFTDVHYFRNGFPSWKLAGLPVE